MRFEGTRTSDVMVRSLQTLAATIDRLTGDRPRRLTLSTPCSANGPHQLGPGEVTCDDISILTSQPGPERCSLGFGDDQLDQVRHLGDWPASIGCGHSLSRRGLGRGRT